MSSALRGTLRPWKSIPGKGSKVTSLKSLYFQLGATGWWAQPSQSSIERTTTTETRRTGIGSSFGQESAYLQECSNNGIPYPKCEGGGVKAERLKGGKAE